MTLEEAMEILHETLNQCGKDNPTFYGAIAVKVALDYIENKSIPKDKVKEVLIIVQGEKNLAMNNIIEKDDGHLAEYGAVAQELGYIEAKLQELLG